MPGVLCEDGELSGTGRLDGLVYMPGLNVHYMKDKELQVCCAQQYLWALHVKHCAPDKMMQILYDFWLMGLQAEP